MKRLLNPLHIGKNLLDRDNKAINLPKSLKDAYVKILTEKNLLDLKKTVTDDSPVGGESKESTEEHFAKRFDGSCARMLLAFFDPKNDLSNTSDILVSMFNGNQISLVDFPCGSGAASLSLISCVAHLRKDLIIPRIPISINLHCGDISKSALENVEQLISNLNEFFVEQAIFVTLKNRICNILKEKDVADLVREVLIYNNNFDIYLLFSNFSGFLSIGNKLASAKDAIKQILNILGNDKANVLWIEPCTNTVTAPGGFASRFINMFILPFINLFYERQPIIISDYKSNYKFTSTLDPNKIHRLNISVIPIKMEV